MIGQPTQKLYDVVIDGAPVRVGLDDLKQRTIDLYASMRRNQETSDRAYVLWGDLLRQLKPQVGHGHWMMFLQACDVHPRTAQRAVKMAEACIINGRFDVSMAHTVMEADRQGTLAKRLQRQTEDANAQETSHLDRRDTPGHSTANTQELSHLPEPGHTGTLDAGRIGMGYDDDDDDAPTLTDDDLAGLSDGERASLREAEAQRQAEKSQRSAAKPPATPAEKPAARPERGELAGQMDMSVLYETAERVRAAMARVVDRIRSGKIAIDEAVRFAEMVEGF